MSRRARQLLLLGTLTWVVLGLLSAAQNATWRAFVGRPIDWSSILPNSLGDWLSCGLFTPAFYLMVRRFPIRGARWWSRLPVHLAASIGFVLLKVAIWTPLYNAINPAEPRTYQQILINGFYADLLAYWAAIGVIHAIEYYSQTARLDTALRVAELANLRAQLQPHFLFNTLQSISTLMHRDSAAADRMLTDLSELLRLSLRTSGTQEVPLREELGFLERYLAIMRVRFGDRLAISVDAAPDVLDVLVPSLVLQPIVENAIRHGMADRPDRGKVEVRAAREDGKLRLEIADDGPGLPLQASEGIGLTNTRERLDRLYGSAASVVISNGSADPGATPRGGPGPGLTVLLRIPLRAP
jgi:two-component system, LytTR family, sensor kinase